MELKDMTVEQLEERRQAIAAEVDAPEADLDALESEARAIKAELEERKAAEVERQEVRDAVANGAGEIKEEIKEERNKMTMTELRNDPRYIDAYANYMKTGRDTECRGLMTENGLGAGNGGVPVPELVDSIVRTAWEKNGILSRVRKTYFKGNVKVAFERSADAAFEHDEGDTEVTEESLLLGIVELIPKNVKKFLHLSDEAAAMGGAEFIRYIYDELTYQIVKKLADLVIADIAGASTSHSATAVGIPQVASDPAIGTIATAFAQLSDEAENPVVIMNKLTYDAFYAAYAAGSFAVDPFMGFPVLYTSALPAFSTASSTDVYAIVGDLNGAQVNYPEGDDVVIKWDDLSEAEIDMIKVVGRQYCAHGVTAPGRFCNITKE